VSGPDLFALLAYGPAPGVELIPYFLALLGWVGLAFSAILVAPVAALLRRLRRKRGAPAPDPKREPLIESVPESPGERSHDTA
jgi:hypothetical protein